MNLLISGGLNQTLAIAYGAPGGWGSPGETRSGVIIIPLTPVDLGGSVTTRAAPLFRVPPAPKWLFHFSNNHAAAAANEGADSRRRGSRGETKRDDSQNKDLLRGCAHSICLPIPSLARKKNATFLRF